MNKLELLCPAGDMDRLKTAILYGADAVYLGSTEFGMRAAPSNFTIDELHEAADYAHKRNVKIYVTVNTIPHPDETPALPNFLKEVGKTGVDALIVTDLGVISLARKLLPDMELHASTQVGICNELTANMLGDMGIKRVVLARELSLDEIKKIRDRIDPKIMIEAFVHGAMCMSISGRCTLSEYLTGRDANRGACTQPCRWNYYLMEEKRPGLYMPINEDENGTTILSAKDLNMQTHLKDLADAGVESFKIEGRAKTSYYVAVVANAYRMAVNALIEGKEIPAWAIEELNRLSHREYSTGFFYGRDPNKQTYVEGGYIQDWEISARAIKVENNRLFVTEKNKFSQNDTLQVLEPGKEPFDIVVEDLKDINNNAINEINHPEDVVSFNFSGNISEGAVIRRKKK